MGRSSAVIKPLIFFTFFLHLSSSITHSLQYVNTAVTPVINVPEYTSVGLVNKEQFMYYDSEIREAIPKTKMIQKVDSDIPDYWKQRTELFKFWQGSFKPFLNIVMNDYNHITGLHTLQWMYGCELDDDGTIRGYSHIGYDGEDYITFDLKTKTWIPATPQIVMSKQIKNLIAGLTTEGRKNYLETTCIEWLKKYVSYGGETLERKVSPEVSVFHKQSPSPEVVCHATGYFPTPLNITWQKDGEDVHEDVELRETLPNQDGSFQKRSILKVPAEELQKHNYTCVVQHSSLEEDLVREVPKGPNKLEL
ncbi:BOLA class I histocompatibility antigen, alpha chain BL3-6-like [Clarias gariepinus]